MATIQLLQRSARSLVCLGVLGTSTLSFGAAALPQITQPVDNQKRMVLKGNVRPMPQRARDLGAVDINTPASRLLLLLKRPAEQETALQQYIAQEHTPGNPNYRHWLTPAEIGSQFGPADSDIQAVVAWLQSQGLAVAKISAAKTTIEFSGTTGQIEKAFATKIHSIQLDGVNHVANVSDPQIPAALAPVIAGISPLNNFYPKPMHTAPLGRTATPAPTSANPKAMSIQPSGNRPDFTFQTQGGANFYGVGPIDFATIYDTPNSTLNKAYSGPNLTGTGVTIGIAGDSNVDLTNVTNYRKLFDLPLTPAPTVVVDGSDPGVGTGDEVEALLDLEVASAVAPGANITLYTAQDTTFQSGLYLAIQRALDDNAINILNVSFGGCEAYQGQAGNQEINNFWEQAAAQGISVTVSTGDSGSAGCDNPNIETAAVQGLQVNGIASTPFNIAVGGTDFNQNSSNESTYWNSTNSGSGVGGSAKGPIPEIPWNDSTSTVGPLSGNKPLTDGNGNTNISGAGGGVSACLDGTVDGNTGDVLSCNGNLGYAKPAWQSGTSSTRELPDISLFAADGVHDSAWILCASNLGANPNGPDCSPDQQGQYSFQLIGGTSASSPAFAGVLALVSQQLGGARLGQADYTLYPLSQNATGKAAFHDVTTGNIAVFCDVTNPGTQNCNQNGFLSGYDAAAGYDEASGLGSLDVAKLVQSWSSITFKPTTTSLTVNGSSNPVSITHGSPVNVAVTVTSSGGTPTGDVALVAGNGNNATAVAPVQGTAASPSILTLSNGAASNTSYPYLPGGTYQLTANYGGDGTFASSTSTPPISVTVSPEPSTLGLFVQQFAASTGSGAPATSVPYGTYVSVAAEPFSTAEVPSLDTLTYVQQATGTVTFSSTPAAYAPLNQKVNVNSNGIAEIPNQLSIAYPPGTYTVKASYSGDPSFSASTATPQTFTVTKNNVTISAANGSTANTAVVEVDPGSIGDLFFSSGFLLPTGAVTLTSSGGATVGTGTLAVVNTSNGQAAQATITLSGTPANISYAGDGNYNPGTASFTPSTGAFSLSAAPPSITLSSGGSQQTTMSITPSSGFTGTVNLSCSSSNTSALTCSLAQPSVSITGSAAATDTLTVKSTASAALHIPANPADRWYAAGGITLAGILLFGLPRRRRAWQRMLGLMLLFITVGVVGCGGGGSNNNKNTYTVTVTATSGASTQTSSVQVTVQ